MIDRISEVDLDNSSASRIHIVGIGGAGMSAIATVLFRMGKSVSGSDLKQSQVTERLISTGIDVHVPHSPDLITSDISYVVRSSAIHDDNEEIIAAREQLIPVLARADMLAALCARESSVGIAGSHGKTTTTSMVTAIARAADMNPSFMIGGDVNEIGTNAGYNKGSLMIVEADESDRTFLTLPLVGGIVTNIENDHLESYNDSFDELKESFYEFILGVQGPVVVCVDEENGRSIAERALIKREVITVGRDNADWTYVITHAVRGGITAQIFFRGEPRTQIELAVPGAHNIRNAMCGMALMSALGVDDQSCIKGLASFGGVARRFQFRGQTRGITFVDDYAHLPSEIVATLGAARDGEFRNVIAIFQPHRFSRTEVLYKEFAQALLTCDVVAVCDVYSAGEAARPGVTGELISKELEALGHGRTHFVRHIDDVINFVDRNAGPGDIVLTLGAGDVTMYSDVIQDALAQTTTATSLGSEAAKESE